MDANEPGDGVATVSGPLPLPLWHRARRWRHSTVNRRIFAAAVLVGCATVVVKIAAFGKDLVVASHFGVGDALDAFLIASMLPSYIGTVLVGSVTAALVPSFVRVREQEGDVAASRLLVAAVRPFLLLLVIASIALYVIAPLALPLLGSGFVGAKLALAQGMLLWLVPTLILGGVGTICVAILNADEQFLLAAAVPLVSPLVLLAALLGAGREMGVLALALGTLGGAVLEVLVLVRSGAVRRVLRLSRDDPRPAASHPAARVVTRQYAASAISAALVSATTLVDQGMAATLGPGSLSTLFFGQKLVASLSGIGILALGTAVLPHLSRLVAVDDWSGIQNTLRAYARLIAVVTVPFVLGIAFFSEPLVRLLFERGAFTPSDTPVVARVQALFVVQVPFLLLGVLGVRLLSAMGKNPLLAFVSLLNLVVNILGNYFLMSRMGIAGIALSTTVVYMVSSLVIYFLTARAIAERVAARAGAP